jgi:hypothetical protein
MMTTTKTTEPTEKKKDKDPELKNTTTASAKTKLPHLYLA